MRCPHCMVAFDVRGYRSMLSADTDGKWYVVHGTCPSCERIVVYLQMCKESLPTHSPIDTPPRSLDSLVSLAERTQDIRSCTETTMVVPKGSSRPPCPPEVDDQDIAEDYAEACLVLADSPKASAALSRRCLQNLLRKKANVEHGRLYDEIQEAMQGLPTYLKDEIDDVRQLGNIATHPIASKTTGEIVPVELWEAEAMLNILEGLFDFYYVQPARSEKRKKHLQDKKA